MHRNQIIIYNSPPCNSLQDDWPRPVQDPLRGSRRLRVSRVLLVQTDGTFGDGDAMARLQRGAHHKQALHAHHKHYRPFLAHRLCSTCLQAAVRDTYCKCAPVGGRHVCGRVRQLRRGFACWARRFGWPRWSHLLNNAQIGNLIRSLLHLFSPSPTPIIRAIIHCGYSLFTY